MKFFQVDLTFVMLTVKTLGEKIRHNIYLESYENQEVINENIGLMESLINQMCGGNPRIQQVIGIRVLSSKF
jgi:hypothetical protein